MRLRDLFPLFEDGRIVQGVNTTCDVGLDEIAVQAAKFGFQVSPGGVPTRTYTVDRPEDLLARQEPSRLDETASGRVLYHCTFASRLPSIRKTGIEPGRRRLWQNRNGQRLGQQDSVYLFTDWSAAVRWAAHMEWEFKREVVILCVRNPGLETRPDENPFATRGHGLATASVIPWSAVARVIPLTLDLKRSIVNGGTAPDPDLDA